MQRIKSLSFNQAEILRDIMDLHNAGQPFECDPTYSKGVFYRQLPKPRYRFDLNPLSDAERVQQADARYLPLPDASLSSIVFDPPFAIKNPRRQNGHLGIVESRFSGYGSAGLLYAFYREALLEFWRVLKPGGLLVFKCQDTVSGGRQHWSHVRVYEMASALGFEMIDLFVLASRHPMWSPNMSRQQHARKAHSYFLCFRKPRPRANVQMGKKNAARLCRSRHSRGGELVPRVISTGAPLVLAFYSTAAGHSMGIGYHRSR